MQTFTIVCVTYHRKYTITQLYTVSGKMSLLCLAETHSTRESILIIFGVIVTEKVGNQRYFFRLRLTSASALSGKMQKHKNNILSGFHSNAVQFHCQTSTSCWPKLVLLLATHVYADV